MIKIGDIIGDWVVVEKASPYVSPSGYFSDRWQCRCICGTEKPVRASSLECGDSKGCGCTRAKLAGDRVRTHGLSKHPLYGVWRDVVRRCTEPSRKDYKHYGGRGIKVCERWSCEQGCEKFIEDMFPTYVEGLEIERVDVNGNYEPSNCTWVTRREQVINRRPMGSSFDAHFITYDDKTLCISQWADETGIPSRVLIDRLGKLAWSHEKAFTTPCRPRETLIHFNGKVYKTDEFIKHPPNVHVRAKKSGLSFQQYIANVLYGKAKVVGMYSGAEIEIVPTKDMSSDISAMLWKVDPYTGKTL